MILVGLGGNLAGDFGGPQSTLEAALARFPDFGLGVARRSPWYRSEPVPVSDQPWYVNGVAVLDRAPAPAELLHALQDIEAEFGRRRSVANAARTLDLDLLAYDEQVWDTPDLVLPHPRLHLRAFVLYPLCDVAPAWRHPVNRLSAAEMVAALPPGQRLERLP